jgi:hypothetical protein
VSSFVGNDAGLQRGVKLAILFSLGCAYLPFLAGGILTDDFLHITRQLNAPSLSEIFRSPDPFRFYRPVVQASFWLDMHLFGFNPPAFRLVNLALHVLCVISVFLLARALQLRPRGAWLAALAFTLMPKVHPIAVLWISARNDLLMALFVMLTVIAWIRWTGSDRPVWLAAAIGTYLLALLSKETAILLPLLLLLVPTVARRSVRHAMACSAMLGAALVILLIRFKLGALMPDTSDAHYSLLRPAGRWMRNLENYIGRALPSPLGLLVIFGTPLLLGRRHLSNLPAAGRYLLFAAAWFLIFMLPALPIVARSELYLYLPSVGLCLFAAYLVDSLIDDGPERKWLTIALAVYVLAFGTYQVTRSYALGEDLRFSARLMSALSEAIGSYSGSVVILPADDFTKQFLADSVGGYGDLALKMAAGRSEVNGTIDYNHDSVPSGALRLVCSYEKGHVSLTRP